jgi:asparagine synthase (glutamine-hydrolysing)
MCGIAAILRSDGRPVDQPTLERMTASLVHRGPDEGRLCISGSVGLGFRRLSILDLSPSARQPMTSEDGGLALIFNGEIFNYIELREELMSRGHRFRSTGDTEVLLRAYQEWGQDCLPKLNGMWAFLVHDRRRGVVFGARDRFGVKPLYRYRSGPVLFLASEIKAIRASGAYPEAINWATAAKFLRHGRLDDGEDTFYAGINQVPAGTAFEVDAVGGTREWTYWSLNDLPAVDTRDPVSSFRDLFEDSVRLRMRSDVPLGVCLSGGLDSSSIICATARGRQQADEPEQPALMAFCYMAPEYDETKYIFEVLEQTGAHLKRLETSPALLWERLPEVLRYQDEPVHSLAAVIGYELMRFAAAHGIRVILNGQGADETIGGYFSYFMDYWRELLVGGRAGKAWDEMKEHATAHGRNPSRLMITALQNLAWGQLNQVSTYRHLAHSRHRWKLERDRWFVPDLGARMGPAPAGSARELNAVLKQSVSVSPLPLYLRVEDRNSMAHSIEARLPFLDYRLVSLALTLGPEWKMRGGTNKFLLREAMRECIPESVRVRKDKMGFPTPARTWLGRELYEQVRDLLQSRRARERGIYHVPAMLQDLEAHRRGEIDVSDRLLHVAQFELWTSMLT